MTKKIVIALFIAVALASCATSKKNTDTSKANQSFPASVPKSTDDGLSFSTAIVITETSETKGVGAEYSWIKQHYSNYTIHGQSLSMHDNKPYDIITIVLSDNKKLGLYFDISNYFGKF